jgi:hypothetical protein
MKNEGTSRDALLRCQHCGERIVARGFGKCPGCYRDLPEELQLSLREKELEAMDEKWRKEDELMGGGAGSDGMGAGAI